MIYGDRIPTWHLHDTRGSKRSTLWCVNDGTSRKSVIEALKVSRYHFRASDVANAQSMRKKYGPLFAIS